jgi:exopolysaccharide biosynthesis protein
MTYTDENRRRGAGTHRRRPKPKRTVKTFLIHSLIMIVETAVLIVFALYGTMFVLAKGPSVTARNLFVNTVQETSALKFLANLYFSQDEIDEIRKGKTINYEQTNTSLVHVNGNTASGQADAWGKVDDDGDGIILEEVKGAGYAGYMMIVLDPSRVIVGAHPEDFGTKGYSVEAMVKSFDAVAGVNAGGFNDPGGTGNGSEPDSLVVYDGQYYYSELGTGTGFVGLDSNHIMHTGNMTEQEIRDADIQYGVCFGPALIVNGEPVDPASLPSGINPRTAIGQRSDGAILLLVIDGRQATSLGASYSDLSEIMYKYGAVTACNLDGGSSSMMYYKDKYVNNSSSVIGIRDVPDTFIVLKEGAGK